MHLKQSERPKGVVRQSTASHKVLVLLRRTELDRFGRADLSRPQVGSSRDNFRLTRA